MSSKMLIDASHPEETRVVVLKGHRVEEFDFEAANRKQLRGNIYLAKVTRVEPSLQAAFVDYGGNRHGFLAFSEIHPDYYQIPHADRQALLEEEARAHRDEDDEGRGNTARRSRRNRRDGSERAQERRGPAEETVSEPASPQDEAEHASGWVKDPAEFHAETDEHLESLREFPDDAEASSSTEASFAPSHADDPSGQSEDAAARPADVETEASTEGYHEPVVEGGAEASAEATDENRSAAPEDVGASLIEVGGDSPIEARSRETDDHGSEDGEDEFVEQIGGDALEDAVQRAPRARRHHYKIQEVIKRRQILLVQVVKEERGNKGAALTTYLSLAGRYSVLMPNTARGGGISRKITDSEDRKRLKSIAQDLEVPEGMGIILRTAGASRSKIEVNRDFEYLLRMWESVRELTLQSTAPTLVYEEGSLIKRSIRDLYTRDVEEVIVSGEEGYREAREFMRMLMPGAAKSVQLYRDPQPIFARAGAEAQLDAMFSNHVTLKSGGYLVINQTEALVAIDVNSGRSTREHNIEDTALRTNLEAADEVARQLRLRDLAGLIVVDFIDMEEGRNNRAVERRIKDALKNDRARIQIGRISHFGLLEMSRQRIRTGVLEGSTVVCPHCAGAGTIRSTASIALHVLRLLEDALIKDDSHNLIVRTRTEVALYVLNQKRAKLTDLEARFGVSLMITVDTTLNGMIYHAIERGEPATPALTPPPRQDLVRVDSVAPLYDEVEEEGEIEEDISEDGGSEAEAGQSEREFSRGDGTAEGGRRRKRRRRRRGRDRDGPGEIAADAPQPSDDGLATMARIEGDFSAAGTEDHPVEDNEENPPASVVAESEMETPDIEADAEAPLPVEAEPTEQPRRRRSRRSAAKADSETEKAAPVEVEDVVEAVAPAPKRRRSRAKAVVSVGSDITAPSAADTATTMELPLGEAPVAITPSAASQDPIAMVEEAEAHLSVVRSPLEGASVAETQAPNPDEPPLPKRSGWWQRAKATFGS